MYAKTLAFLPQKCEDLLQCKSSSQFFSKKYFCNLFYENLRLNESLTNNFVKDCLPYLFHGFRNKYCNKISLDNMLYFQNELYKFWETAWFFDKYAIKIIFRIKCKLPFASWPVRISTLTTCVMWSCTANFLIRARDCDVWINYFCPIRQFQSRSETVLNLSYF